MYHPGTRYISFRALGKTVPRCKMSRVNKNPASGPFPPSPDRVQIVTNDYV